MHADVVIVGAGPAGLCLARSLSGQGLKIVIVEQQSSASLESPAFDGREIALTQHSAQILKTLGLWNAIDAHDLAPLRDAKVFDGATAQAMRIGHELSAYPELGWLVSNHLIRKAAFECVQAATQQHGDVTLITDQKVVGVVTSEASAKATLGNGQTVTARLLVAADSRFSSTRRMLGIPAKMHDFGKNMVVCCMEHEQPHNFTAWEWFDYGQTLALLPMNPDPVTGKHRSSVVITQPSVEAERLMALPIEAFNAEVACRYQHRLGVMQLRSTRHNYPLVGVYPTRLVATRFAAVGDAAVGMHPVTAHGFNFGLLGVATLSQSVLAAHRLGADIANPELLARYARQHRRATLPLYLTTQLIVALYTQDSRPAKFLRKLGIGLGDRLTPFKRAIAHSLAGHG